MNTLSTAESRLPSRNEVLNFRDAYDAIGHHIRRIAGPEELQILEAGCGRKWPIDLDGVSHKVTGVDVDRHALESRKAAYGDLDEFVIGDLHDVQLPQASFDVVYSAFVLEHIDGAERVLQKFVDWLKPGGLLILTLPDPECVYGFFTRMTPFWVHVLYYRYVLRRPNAGRPGFGPYPTYYDQLIWRRRLRRFLVENGFRMDDERPFGRLSRMQQRVMKVLSALSFGRLSGDHVCRLYVARRMSDAPALPA